jgi:hypothetical protein
MQDLLKWTLDHIRKNEPHLSWMEELRYDWTPAVSRVMQAMFEDDDTILLVTDKEHEWFSRYILTHINIPSKKRPYLPFIALRSLFPHIGQLKTKEEYELLEDMLSLSFPNGYTYFYIGRENESILKLIRRDEDSFIWNISDTHGQGFRLLLGDEMLDIKLIQLFKLFDKTIDAVLFAEIDIG